MNKKTVICMGLVMAALACGMTLVGCNGEVTPSGEIEVYNSSESTTYWVKTSYDMDEVRAVKPKDKILFWFIKEEGRHTVYYCQQNSEEESVSDTDNSIWFSAPCSVSFEKTAEVTIPYYGEVTPSGEIKIYNSSESKTYWVKTSYDMDDVRAVKPKDEILFGLIKEEGRHTVLYCQKNSEEESASDIPANRPWFSASCSVSFEETAKVTIPY